MATWTKRVSGLLVGLGIGLSVSFAWNSHRNVSLCEINADPAKYSGKSLRFRVFISNDNGSINAGSVCAKDDIQGASVDLDPRQVGLLGEGRHTRTEQSGFFISEVIVVGKFEPPDGFTHCFTPKYHISNASIERVLARHEFQNSERLVEWFNSKFR